jgi:hypothetical protein
MSTKQQQGEMPLDAAKSEPRTEAAQPAEQEAEPKPPEHNPEDVKKALVAVTDEEESGGATRALSAYGSETAFKAAYRMAKSIAYGTLVPAAYQGEKNIPNVMIAMELANRIGASIMMVMQSLHVIQGRPSWAAQFLIATVNASRKFTPIRFRFFGSEGSDGWGCRAWAKDRETDEECVGALITIGMAKAEGWATKSGSKWKTMPEQMLMYRSAAFWTRIYAPELSLGMQTTEEVIDTTGYEVTDAPDGIRPGSPAALEASLRNGSATAATVE